MPAPATVPEFLDLVQKSGVADEAKFKAYLDRVGGAAGLPPEPPKAAGHLVRDAILTFFQAEQILQGKWKRFSIGKYKVLEKLGSGGMGQVFLCEHKLMRRRVAVKVLPTAKAADQASLDRFYREARAVAAVDHPNIVRAYDIDQDDNLHFLVMEYVDGTNLQDLVKKIGPVDPVRACHYIYGSAVGLQHAHEIGIVHRDVKPGNVLLDRSGVVKILDMGLARFFHDTEDHITRKYDENILGTADYLSPEQAEDSHTVDIRSDIYSLGATFYFLLTGHQPFPEGTIPQKLIWHRTREPRPVREYRADVPPGVAAVLARMMAKKPDDRYQTPAEVMAALQPWVTIPIAPPSDAEMPVLSPLVAGPQAARAANAQRAAGPALLVPAEVGSGVRVTASPSMTHVPPAPALLTPRPLPAPEPERGPGVWESLDDVSGATAGDTGRAGRTVPEAMPPRPRTAGPRKGKLPLALAALGLLVVAGGGVGAYFAFFRPKPDGGGNVQAPPTTGGRKLVVSKAKAGAELTYPSLAAAVGRAAHGDTIAVEEPTLTEAPLRITGKRDLTIESALPDGKPVVFNLTTTGAAAAAIEIASIENLRVRGFVIDAQGGADYAVQMTGALPGVALEHVTVQGGKKGGVRLANPTGQSGRPVVLDHLRVPLGADHEAGVRVESAGNLTSRWVTVRGGAFIGPGKAGVRFDGAADAVEVTNTRFYQLNAALLLHRPGDRQPLKVEFTQNTVMGGKVGVMVAAAPPGTPAVALGIHRNYFTGVTEAMARADADLPGVAATHNGRNAQSQAGNVNVNAVEITPAPAFVGVATDDPGFLRFAGAPPTLDGRRIGAE